MRRRDFLKVSSLVATATVIPTPELFASSWVVRMEDPLAGCVRVYHDGHSQGCVKRVDLLTLEGVVRRPFWVAYPEEAAHLVESQGPVPVGTFKPLPSEVTRETSLRMSFSHAVITPRGGVTFPRRVLQAEYPDVLVYRVPQEGWSFSPGRIDLHTLGEKDVVLIVRRGVRCVRSWFPRDHSAQYLEFDVRKHSIRVIEE